MKKVSVLLTLLFIFCSFAFCQTADHEDYPVFMKNYWKENNNSTREQTDFLLQTSEGKAAIVKFEKVYVERSRYIDSMKKLTRDIENEFKNNNTHPEEYSAVREYESLRSELESMVKSIRQMETGTTLAKAALDACRSWSKDCSRQEQTYNNIANRYNAKVQEYNNKKSRLDNMERRRNEIINEYNAKAKGIMQQVRHINEIAQAGSEERTDRLNECLIKVTEMRKKLGIGQ